MKTRTLVFDHTEFSDAAFQEIRKSVNAFGLHAYLLDSNDDQYIIVLSDKRLGKAALDAYLNELYS